MKLTFIGIALLAVPAALGRGILPVRPPPAGQLPFGRPTTEGRESDARHRYTNYFSGQSSWPNRYFQSEIEKLYEGKAMVVTNDFSFQLLAYAAEHSSEVKVTSDDAFETIKSAIYLPPRKRLDGRGVLYEQVWFAGYKVQVGDDEFTGIVASWPTMMGIDVQWHLVGDRDKARTLIEEVTSWAQQIRDAVLVFQDMWWQPDYDLWRSVQKASWDDVILEEGFKKRLQREYRNFFKSEKVYKDLGVPWKRGLIFLGPPGNGKTISLKALMKDVDVPTLYVKSLDSWGPPQLAIRLVFQRARAEAPCVLVFEDLDSMINDGNRAYFLNEVDGIDDNDGLLLIATTNHFDRLDPALSNRPSRFDRKYFFDNPTHSEREQYAEYWRHKLSSNPRIEFPKKLITEVADKTERFSFAYLKEAFVAALIILAEDDGDEKRKLSFADVLREQIKFLRKELERDDPQNATTSTWKTQYQYDGGAYGYGHGPHVGGADLPTFDVDRLRGQEGVRIAFMP